MSLISVLICEIGLVAEGYRGGQRGQREIYLMAKLPAMDFEAVLSMSGIMTRQVLFYSVLNRSARCRRSRLSFRAGGTSIGSLPAAASMAFQVPILPA